MQVALPLQPRGKNDNNCTKAESIPPSDLYRTFDTFTQKQIFSDLLAISKREREIPHSILLFFVPVSLFLACDHNFMHYIFSLSSKRGKKCLLVRALPRRRRPTAVQPRIRKQLFPLPLAPPLLASPKECDGGKKKFLPALCKSPTVRIKFAECSILPQKNANCI